MNSKQAEEKNFDHPERRVGEVFLTNCDAMWFDQIPCESKRAGHIPYTGMGEKLEVSDWFPVFIEEAEIRAKNLDLRCIRVDLHTARDMYLGSRRA